MCKNCPSVQCPAYFFNENSSQTITITPYSQSTTEIPLSTVISANINFDNKIVVKSYDVKIKSSFLHCLVSITTKQTINMSFMGIYNQLWFLLNHILYVSNQHTSNIILLMLQKIIAHTTSLL